LFLFFCFSINSFFIFYLSFEFVFLILFVYLFGWGLGKGRRQASYYMIFYTIVVSFPLFLFFITFSIFEDLSLINSFLLCSTSWWLFLVIVFLVKLPVVGVHLWLPKAHVEAPLAGSMLLAGVFLKIGAYGLLRFFRFFVGFVPLGVGYLFSLGLIGAVFSCFFCFRQVDIKSLVAYSSICHMGLCLRGLFSCSFYGFKGSVFMLFSHGVVSPFMFFLVYVLYYRFYTRRIFLVKGGLFSCRILSLVWFIFSIFNIGCPPSVGFFSEVLIIVGGGSNSFISLFFFICLVFFVCVYCIYFFLYFNAWGVFFFFLRIFKIFRKYFIFLRGVLCISFFCVFRFYVLLDFLV